MNEIVSDVRAIVVLDEEGSEHDGAERPDRKFVFYHLVGTWVPDLSVLVVKWHTEQGRKCNEASHESFIAASHGAAVRMAVERADAVRALVRKMVAKEL